MQDSNSALGFTAVGLKEGQLGVRWNPVGTRQMWKFDGNRSEKQGKVNPLGFNGVFLFVSLNFPSFLR